MSTRRGFILALTILFFVLIIYFITPDIFELYEMQILDWQMRLKGPTNPGNLVKLILVDTSSRKQYGMRGEFRQELATVINNLKAGNARVVGLDLYFLADMKNGSNTSDAQLAAAVKEAGNVVIGYNWDYNLPENRLATAEAIGRRQLLLATRNVDEPGFTPEQIPQEARIASHNITRHAASVGYFSVIVDPYLYARKVPATLSYKNRLYYPFSLAIVRTFLNQDGYGIHLNQEKDSLTGPQLGNIKLQPDHLGYLWFNYYGSTEAFETLRFDDVVKNGIPPGFANGAIVLIGVSGEDSGDLFATSFDIASPGVVLHATAVANALSNGFLWRDNMVRIIEIVILALITLIMGLLLPRLAPSLALFISPTLMVLLIVGSHYVLVHNSMWIHLIMPSFLIIILQLVIFGYRVHEAEHQAFLNDLESES